jgi:hypothetical protein
MSAYLTFARDKTLDQHELAERRSGGYTDYPFCSEQAV